MSIEIEPTGAGAGAEVRGVDLACGLSEAQFAELEAALDRYGVLCFRGQSISPEQQVSFTRRFGEPEFNFNAANFGIEGSPEIYVISNILEGGKPIGTRRAGETWHTDMSYAQRPARATMLFAVEVPSLHGLALGGTEFANAQLAWDRLPDEMQESLLGLRGVFDFRGRKRSSPVSPENVAAYPPVEHPIVRTHPRSGRKGLYVVRDDCTGIVDMAPEVGSALIEALADHITRPEFVYRHQWQPGDLIVWDNCTVQHRAIIDYELPQRRLMWRTTIRGEIPS